VALLRFNRGSKELSRLSCLRVVVLVPEVLAATGDLEKIRGTGILALRDRRRVSGSDEYPAASSESPNGVRIGGGGVNALATLCSWRCMRRVSALVEIACSEVVIEVGVPGRLPVVSPRGGAGNKFSETCFRRRGVLVPEDPGVSLPEAAGKMDSMSAMGRVGGRKSCSGGCFRVIARD